DHQQLWLHLPPSQFPSGLFLEMKKAGLYSRQYRAQWSTPVILQDLIQNARDILAGLSTLEQFEPQERSPASRPGQGRHRKAVSRALAGRPEDTPREGLSGEPKNPLGAPLSLKRRVRGPGG